MNSPDTDHANLWRKVKLARLATLAGLAGLVVVIVLSTLWFVPSNKSPNLVICVLSLIPLALITPWIILKNVRAHIWLCFILLGYFLGSVENAFLVEEYGRLPLVEIAILVFLFVAATLFARWQHQVLHTR